MRVFSCEFGPFKAKIRVRFPLAVPNFSRAQRRFALHVSYLENPTVANIFRSSNPVLKDKVFAGQIATGETMSVQGTDNKSCILLLCVVATAAWTLGLAHSEQPEAAYPWMIGGLIGGLITCLVTIFKKEWSALSAPIYALFEGLVLGGISAIFEKSYPGIAVQSVALTFGVLFVLLMAYTTGLIRATRGFVLGIICATGAIALVYAATMLMRLFGFGGMSFLYASTPLGIGISVFVVIIAALNLILDFDMIERGAGMGAPKYMEWYGAFALMVTLIWLYMEILRLLGKVRRR